MNDSKCEEHLVTENGYDCEIGNDVWIGDNALIKGGIKVGDGAVIAMGSVVIHDVEPYTIVAGVPAKRIRTRFDEETVRQLERIKWWEKPKDWLEKHADEFENIDKLIQIFNSDQGGALSE